MSYPRQTLMSTGIVFLLCVRSSGQLSMNLDFDIDDKSFGMLMYQDSTSVLSFYIDVVLTLSIRWFTLGLFMFMVITVGPSVGLFPHFQILCICWEISWKGWHKMWHADVSRWLTPYGQWLLLSFDAFVHLPNCPWAWVLVFRTNRLEAKSIFCHADVSRWLTLSLYMRMGIIDCHSPHFQVSLHLLVNHLERMAKNVMLMYPNNLPSANIDACFHFLHLSICLTSHGIEFGIEDGSLGRYCLHFGMLMYPDDLSSFYRRLWVLLSICWFVRSFVCVGLGCVRGWLLPSLGAYWQHILVPAYVDNKSSFYGLGTLFVCCQQLSW